MKDELIIMDNIQKEIDYRNLKYDNPIKYKILKSKRDTEDEKSFIK